MGKSLGDYNIEKSSSSDINNIKWLQKNQVDKDKSKNKKKTARKTSPSNIIYTHETEKVKPPVEKIFKIEEVVITEKSKNKKEKRDKRVQTSSTSNSKIKQSFSRHAR